MFGVMMLSSCLFEPDPQETIEKPLNLNDLENWVVNGSVNKTAVDSFGYENCFRIVPISDDVWDDFTLYYQGDKEAVSRNDYSTVRTLFYYKESQHPIHIGEIICHNTIASDLLDIFRQLYEASYSIEALMPMMKMGLSDLTDSAAPGMNFSFCFHFLGSPVDELHLKGLAVVLNPYNPPTADDLAVRLFKEHGFTWGGDVDGGKQYRFEKGISPIDN